MYDDDDMIHSRKTLVKSVREEYAKWLSSVFGQVPQVGLGTYTFQNPDIKSHPLYNTIGRQYVSRAARQLVSLLLAHGSTCFVCVEEGSDTRRLHLHSLETLEGRTKSQVHQWWRRKYGFESYKVVSSLQGVSLYVTKYVTKGDMPFYADGPLYRTHNEVRPAEPVLGVHGYRLDA